MTTTFTPTQEALNHIKSGGPTGAWYTSEHIEDFDPADHALIAYALIDGGFSGNLAARFRDFAGLDHSAAALAILDKGRGDALAQNLHNFRGLSAEVGAKLIEEGYAEAVGSHRGSFAEDWDIEECARCSSEAGAYTVALYHLDLAMRAAVQGNADPAGVEAAQVCADAKALAFRIFLENLRIWYIEFEGEFWPEREGSLDDDDRLAGFQLTPVTRRTEWTETATGWTLTGAEFVAELVRWAGDGWQWKIKEGDGPCLRSDYPSGEDAETCMRDVEVCVAAQEWR